MSNVPSDSFALAYQRLQTVLDPHRDGEDPSVPATVQAMPIVLEIPKSEPPARTPLLEAAARAVVAVCLDPRAGEETVFADALMSWYGARIRKISRRARNSAWERVQTLPGVTVEHNGARARAFVPSAVQDTEPLLSKLQIGGTEVPADDPGDARHGVPIIAVDESLGMSVGKAAAQVGHASMLLAAQMPLEWTRAWAKADFPLQVRHVRRDEFARLVAQPGAVPVRDAGYTEVAPGSVTVVALPNGF